MNIQSSCIIILLSSIIGNVWLVLLVVCRGKRWLVSIITTIIQLYNILIFHSGLSAQLGASGGGDVPEGSAEMTLSILSGTKFFLDLAASRAKASSFSTNWFNSSRIKMHHLWVWVFRVWHCVHACTCMCNVCFHVCVYVICIGTHTFRTPGKLLH